MTATALASPRFVRRTQLGANEYRKNFHQIDAEVISAITSAEADRVTPLMSKIYLRLASAPTEFWEREGVLYFCGRDIDGRAVKASKVLYELLGVASATAHKALAWMHGQGIIGYFAGKNGAGIRIFLNRATGSIGIRAPAASKKILPFVHGSNGAGAGSTVEPAFNDSFADLEVLETDLNPHAPKNGAEKSTVFKTFPDPQTSSPRQPSQNSGSMGRAMPTERVENPIPVNEIVSRLRNELEPTLRSAARQAAAQEHERTREWLENRGLPKAARVAQREAFNVLRKYGVIREGAVASSGYAEIGRGDNAPATPHTLSCEEIGELAQACIAMLNVHGRPIKDTLSEMCSERGGFLLPDDAAKVCKKAEDLLAADSA